LSDSQPKLIELTDAHKARYPEWRETYINHQLSTDGTDEPEVTARLNDLYARGGYEKPRTVLFAPSPMVAAVAATMARYAIDALAKKSHTKPVVIASMNEAIEKVAQHIHSYFNKIIPDMVDQIDAGHQPPPARLYEIIARLAMEAANLDRTSRVGQANKDLVREFEDNLKTFQSNWNGGNTWAYSHAHLTFFRDVMGAELPLAENFLNYQYLNENSGPRMMYEDFVIVSHRPVVLRTRVLNNVYQMHSAEGPSIAWGDGIALFYHENTQVPPWMIWNRNKLDPRLFPRFTNVSQRAAFCRLVGMERILRANNAQVIASEPGPDEYEVLEMSVGDERFRYLSMQNRSLPGVYHVEGLRSDISTVQQALNFRNGFTDDQICAETGVEWYQQGDIVMLPRGAKKYQPRPSILT
jgi:hypothetical protein